MKELKEQIRKHGLIKSVGRLVGDELYKVTLPIYKSYISGKSLIDDKQILFMSTPSFSDNSRALYEYLKNSPELAEYHFVWLINRKEIDTIQKCDERTEFIKLNTLFHKGETLKAIKKIMTSKYLFFTHASPVKNIKKQKGQVVINLWHGCGYKDVEKKDKAWCEIDPFDYALVPGEIFINIKQRFWGCEKNQIIPIGYPRYDWLLMENDRTQQYVKHLCGNNKKIIVWMPTFRKTEWNKYPEEMIKEIYDLPLFNSVEEVHNLNEYCKEHDVLLCIKRHPFQIRYSCESEYFSNMNFLSNDDFVSNKINLYTFLHYTSALISDYSSVAIDYLLMDKPIAYVLDDMKKYKETRGFVFDDPLEYMPGYHIYSIAELQKFIDDIVNEKDIYREKRAEIKKQVHNPCENYSSRVWKVVKEEMA